MRISSMASPTLPSLDGAMPAAMEAELDGALLERAQGDQKAAGAAAVKLIESAVGVNHPLSEGPVGRLINIRI